jgi:hypothetical protein
MDRNVIAYATSELCGELIEHGISRAIVSLTHPCLIRAFGGRPRQCVQMSGRYCAI